jgi:hypothetical protein
MKLTTQRILRAYLRHELGTWPEGVPLEEWIDRDAIAPALQDNRNIAGLLERVRAIGELFVGMANGPFLLVMRASDPQQFIRYADEHPTHNVHIAFDAQTNPNVGDRNVGVQATVRPADAPEAYSLSFGLPRVLREYILFDETRGIRLAPGLKRTFFSDITVYRRVADRDLLYRLTYEPQAIRRLPAGT